MSKPNLHFKRYSVHQYDGKAHFDLPNFQDVITGEMEWMHKIRLVSCIPIVVEGNTEEIILIFED